MPCEVDLHRRRFIERNTSLLRLPLLPEIALHLATEVTPLWSKTQEWLELEDLEPPYWAFAWPGGQALARHILDAQHAVKGRDVLDFATGSGLVAIAASLAGARIVTACDLDPTALAAAELNAEVNLSGPMNVAPIAFDAGDFTLTSWGKPGDLLLAGDVFYDVHASARFSAWFEAAARRGVEVWIGDPGRAYLPKHYERVSTYEVTVSGDVEGRERLSASVFRIL
jgi:predicted nicotinamide N-methyase